MFKFVALCALIVYSQAAPTDNPIESDSTAVVTDKSLPHEHEVVSVKTFSAEKRDKREDDSVSSSTTDNKRTPVLSQPDYQDNKPPTFVFPVPVDQIIKNSNASPEIHSSKQVEEETEEGAERTDVEENVKSTNEDEDDTEQHPKPKPKHVYNKHHPTRTNSESDDESEQN